MPGSNDRNGNGTQEPVLRPINNSFRLEIITDAGRLFSLKPHWDDLCARSFDCYFSQSFQWCSTSWTIMRDRRARRLFCVIGWVDNRMVLIWPFVIFRRGFWRILHPLGAETSVYNDVLVENSPEADHWVALAWQKLRTTSNSDVINLPHVLANCRLQRILSRERPMDVWAISTSGVIWDEIQEWDSYYQSLDRGFRYSLRTGRRRLTERGKLTFDVVTKREQFPPILDWLFFHKSEWLIRTNRRSSWKDADRYKKFLVEVTDDEERTENVMLFSLQIDGRIISAVMARISKSHVEAVIAAFDRTYTKYAPGHLLYEDIVKWAFQRRLEFDFRMGDEIYKRCWANRESKVVMYRFSNSFLGAIFSLGSRTRSKLKSFRR